MDEIIGAAPTSSGWKTDVLAGKLYLHKGTQDASYAPDPTSEKQRSRPPKTFTEITVLEQPKPDKRELA